MSEAHPVTIKSLADEVAAWDAEARRRGMNRNAWARQVLGAAAGLPEERLRVLLGRAVPPPDPAP